MNVLTLQSTYGGLLHDTGKAVGSAAATVNRATSFCTAFCSVQAGHRRWTVCATTTPPRCAVQQQYCAAGSCMRHICLLLQFRVITIGRK